MANIYVYAGQISSSVTLYSKNSMFVLSGGWAKDTTVSSGGWMGVSNGGATLRTIVSSGGFARVYKGGTATSNTVGRGGILRAVGGHAFSNTVMSGGLLDVFSGGYVSSTVIHAGGRVLVSSGSIVHDNIVHTGGSVVISSGAVANNTTLSGGLLRICPGGYAVDICVSAGGYVPVSGGSGGPGGVNHWLGGRTKDCKSFVAGGIFKRFVTDAVAEGIAKLPEHHGTDFSPHGWTRGHLTAGVPFDGLRMAEFLERKCLEAGVELLYFTHFVSCRTEGDKIVSLTFHNKSGLFELRCRQVIDATGDADVAHAAGCRCMIGRDGDRAMAPASLEFHVSHVDTEALSGYIHEHSSNRFLAEIKALTEQGVWKFKYDRLITVQMLENDVYMVNTNRLTGVDGTDGGSITRGMIEGRRECLELFRIMRENIPGFAHARLVRFGSALGIRETRRIVAEKMLRVEDLMADTAMPETIGFVCYNWDLPDPHRPSYQPLHEKKTAIRDRIPLPFGMMKPVGIANLLCPGRSVCAERDVLGAIRVMAACMVMGEAAGVSAATGLRGAALLERLSARGCILA